ncbi:protein kinase domain-containing protein [Nannocystis pusilla]|uniref:serine/threonine-protein kinase n=1 Tax=Nannocystis pusilla TaxID=889268 RepID=UPI003B8017EA
MKPFGSPSAPPSVGPVAAPTLKAAAPAATPVVPAPTPGVAAAASPLVPTPAPTSSAPVAAPTPVVSAPASLGPIAAPAPSSVLDALTPVAPAPTSVLDAVIPVEPVDPLPDVELADATPVEVAEPTPSPQAAPPPTDTPTRMSGSNSSSFSHPPVPAPATIHEGEVLADRYRVYHRLGKGGMGEVYLAEHMDIGRKVAIKTLNAHLQDKPEIADRFMQEARTSSRVRHSNIVDITDFGKTDHGAPFFVMEYLEGEDLKSVLKRERVLPWERARDIILQVCAALAAAHAHGVVHRDLKPDNIYLIRQGDQELVKVLDFGIAKVISEAGDEMTQTGVLLGTPEYMSPEQAQEQPLDGRSDIYAMGVLMFRMFTGRLPFRAKAFMAVLGMHMQQPPPRPSEVDPNHAVSERQEAVILRCLEKKPEDRYQTADELAAAIRAIDAAGAFDIHFEVVPARRRAASSALRSRPSAWPRSSAWGCSWPSAHLPRRTCPNRQPRRSPPRPRPSRPSRPRRRRPRSSRSRWPNLSPRAFRPRPRPRPSRRARSPRNRRSRRSRSSRRSPRRPRARRRWPRSATPSSRPPRPAWRAR